MYSNQRRNSAGIKNYQDASQKIHQVHHRARHLHQVHHRVRHSLYDQEERREGDEKGEELVQDRLLGCSPNWKPMLEDQTEGVDMQDWRNIFSQSLHLDINL